MTPNPETSFDELFETLLNEEEELARHVLVRLSGLSPEELITFEARWGEISAPRRQRVLQDLAELAETKAVIMPDDIFMISLEDEDATARSLAIGGLWENENNALIPIFLKILEEDESAHVRAKAAGALGYFVYLGELNKIPQDKVSAVLKTLHSILGNDEPDIVKQMALSSLGYAGGAEINGFIENAYNRNEDDWVITALKAMGNTADKRWESLVIERLDDPDALILEEAARTAGKLELEEAVPALLFLLGGEDREIRMAAAWSLSEIGGESAQTGLENALEDCEDEDEILFIENALENLDFNQDLIEFDLFNFPDGEADDLPEISE
ncbi:MAG: HEAT repeat domain-containing protein [Anaerolineae bacterium]|nr:HEAT repeat domain-containing protein [Anaerolineae bacterium]